MSSNGVCVVRRELVALVKSKGGVRCHELAMLLNQALYKTQENKTASNTIQEELEYSKEPEPNFDFKHGWFHKSAQTWADETMMDTSTDTIRKMLKWLEDNGFILSRNNPRHRWDKILQYRVNVTYIIDELAKLGLQLKGFESLTETLETFLKPSTAFSETIEAGAVLKSLFKENQKELTTTLPQNGKGATSTSQATANKKAKSVSPSPKSFTLNFETDPSARLLLFFHKTKGTAMPESTNELRKQWLCVKPWFTEATNGDKADIVGIEKRVQEAIRKVLAYFKKEGLTDKGIYSYSDLIKAEIWRIKGQKVVTVTEDEWI